MKWIDRQSATEMEMPLKQIKIMYPFQWHFHYCDPLTLYPFYRHFLYPFLWPFVGPDPFPMHFLYYTLYTDDLQYFAQQN